MGGMMRNLFLAVVLAMTILPTLAADPTPSGDGRNANAGAVSSKQAERVGEQMWVPAPGASEALAGQGAAAKASKPSDSSKDRAVGNDGLTADQRWRLGEAYKGFAGAKPGSKTWYAAAAVCLRYGEAGRKRLAAPVEARYRITMRQYEAAFAKAADKAMKARLAILKKKGKTASQVDEEIRDARKVIADLRAKRDLSKDDLVKQGDPAMATLETLVGLSRKEVFAADRTLAAMRADAMKIWNLRALVREEDPIDSETFATLEDAMALVATPISAASKAALKGNLALRAKVQPVEAEGIADLNRMRLLAGLEALAIDPKLAEAGRAHSKDMAEKGFFSHTSPVPGKRTFGQRARLAGTTAFGENIAYGTSSPQGANRMWFHSPGHFKNMFSSRYRRMGLGYHDRRWTQMFG